MMDFDYERDASSAQVDYVRRLQAEWAELDRIYCKMKNEPTVERKWTIPRTSTEASKQIEAGKQAVVLLRNTILLLKVGEGESPAGVWKDEIGIFRVKIAASSKRPYAERLTPDGYKYVGPAEKLILSSDRVTLEEAARYGKATGICCACGIVLTNPASVKAGIGPVCAKKL